MLKESLAKWREHWNKPEHHQTSGWTILKSLGPGLLVTVGFIDPGNWASNFAAGSEFGYALLWVVTLSTIMLIVLQHNVAHLGIVTGLCLSEAATRHLPKAVSRPVLISAMAASVSTSLAEILGAAIALEMLFGIPIMIGSVMATLVCGALLLSNSYSRVEKGIIGFVSLIGLSFLYELTLTDTAWAQAAASAVTPSLPAGSVLVVMSVLGAVVMPHNLFLHSEVIQSRQINTQGTDHIRHALKFEFYDTLLAMTIGWAINSAMIVLAADTFFAEGRIVESLPDAGTLLAPLLGNSAATVFAIALLLAGIASTVTSGMAAGSIFAGIYDEPYNAKDIHSRAGIVLSLGLGFGIIYFIGDPFKGLIVSQAVLSLQLPFTMFLQVRLTSSKKVMGEYANSPFTRGLLYSMATAVSLLNLYLLWSLVAESI